jgi:hypothetical protein
MIGHSRSAIDPAPDIHWLARGGIRVNGLVASCFEFEEEHINASYTDGQQSQDGTK